MEFFLLLVVFFICFIGIFVLSRRFIRQRSSSPLILPKNYLKGLNFLLNEQPDKAVDIFIDLLAVDEHTVETHLSLGNLFRRRGEVDRAIKIHQNVIARPQLDQATRVQALVALGEDYLGAGVLDRAERVFQEVMILDSSSETALLYLLDIYQQEKEWQKAIDLTEKLPNQYQYQVRMAHYYCELAELALVEQSAHKAQLAIKEALSRDPACLRAYLVQSDACIQEKAYDSAIKCLEKIYDLNPRFLPETLERLKCCYITLNNQAGLAAYLKQCMQDHPHSAILAELIPTFDCSHQLTEHLVKHPSLKGLDIYLRLLGNDEKIALIKSMITVLKKRDAAYQCQECGYSGNIFQWQCPSCKRWGKVLPITY